MIVKGIVSAVYPTERTASVILPEYGGIVTKPIRMYRNGVANPSVSVDDSNVLIVSGIFYATIDESNVLTVSGSFPAHINANNVLVVSGASPALKVNDFVLVVVFNDDFNDCMIL